MKILDRLRNRRPPGEASDPGLTKASSANQRQLPIARYDELDGKQVSSGLARLSPVELATVEDRAREEKAALVQAGSRSHPPTANGDGLPAMKTESRRSRFDGVDAAREERNERERLHEDARYRRERLELYRARLYAGRAVSQGKLRELQRASDGAAARLRQAEARPSVGTSRA
jgi:hypothetical protein